MTKLYDELKTLAEAEVGDPLLAWFLREHLPAILSALKNDVKELAKNRESFHLTFNGGHEGTEHAAFHHGMDTVFNWLDSLAQSQEDRHE